MSHESITCVVVCTTQCIVRLLQRRCQPALMAGSGDMLIAASSVHVFASKNHVYTRVSIVHA